MKSYLDYNIPIVNKTKLPNYPIPNMIDTLGRFLEWVKPLITQEEYEEATISVDTFIKSDNSRKLDEKLRELGNEENSNWLFDYWLKSYLKTQEPLIPYTNVPMVYENKQIKNFNLLEKASALIYGIASVYTEFRKNGSPEYNIGKKRYSSDQFHGVLSSINHFQRDMNKYYINSGFSTNIVVLYRNNIYTLDVINSSKNVLDINIIYNAIKAIYSESTSPIFPNANFVTAEPNRNLAADYLAEILENSRNNESYQKIKDSIFILNLDDDNPSSPLDELYCACMDTSNFNRWNGKGLEFSISKDGIMSFIVDHALADGGTAIYLMDQINLFIKDIKFTKTNDTIFYNKLIFELDDQLSLKLIQSFEDYKTHMNRFTASYVDLENLSRKGLKENGILSGDGFFHIALQAAQKMTYDNICNTYIAVDMRKYFKGRTEANRPITAESIAFVEELLGSKGDLLEQKKLLKEALDAHYNRTVLCISGKGVNRYLYILEQLYHDFKDELDIEKRPNIFDTVAYETINHNKLSTTSFGHENIKYCYFPPVTKDGLGIYYIVGEESFAITTSFNKDAKSMYEFNKNLKLCINKMLEITSAKL